LSKNDKKVTIPVVVLEMPRAEMENPDEIPDLNDQLEEMGLNGGRPTLRPPKTLETTLFDRLEYLYGEGIKRVLQIQYRYVSSFSRSCL
jgi:hypothetical protein